MEKLTEILGKLKGYRTLVVNGIAALLVLATMLMPEKGLPTADEAISIFDGAISLLETVVSEGGALVLLVTNLVLRFKTDTAVGQSE